MEGYNCKFENDIFPQVGSRLMYIEVLAKDMRYACGLLGKVYDHGRTKIMFNSEDSLNEGLACLVGKKVKVLNVIVK